MNLNQVTLPSRDLARAVSFYQLLGLRLIVDALPRYVRFECPAGEATLSLHYVETLPEGPGMTVYFETEELDAEYDRLVAAGVAFEHGPKDQSWRWREARLLDLDENRLVLHTTLHF